MLQVRCHHNRALNTLDDEVDRIFRTFWSREPQAEGPAAVVPAPVDIEETAERYLVSVELPGLAQGDVKVTLVDDALVIRAEKLDQREKKDTNYHRVERRFGSIERVVRLAARVDRDRISATMKDGVLKVDVPKAEEAREREISVKVS
jgi:HSP20 family protein